MEVETLFVFDFDHTLVDDNSDTWIMSICPELKLLENLDSLRKQYIHGWTRLMDHVFSLIHKQGRSKDDVIAHFKRLQLYEQAKAAVRAIHECKTAESIIISDANTISIDAILEESGVRDTIKEIFSNLAHFEENGRLSVKAHHSHHCEFCKRTPNMCKSLVLKNYLETCERNYKKIVYVGDGRNDYCPCTSLSDKDVVICREGYPLARLLHDGNSACPAEVHTINFITSLGASVTSNLS